MIPPLDIDPEAIRIGIDPDVDKSGFAVFDPTTDTSPALYQYDLLDLVAELTKWADKNDPVVVIIEAGWLEKKTNWHFATFGPGVGQKIAQGVGRNHQIGREIEKACQKIGIDYLLRKPRGYTKYKHATYCALTKHNKKKRTNPETRVAGLFAFFG